MVASTYKAAQTTHTSISVIEYFTFVSVIDFLGGALP